MNRHRAVLMSLTFTLVLAVPALGQGVQWVEPAVGGTPVASDNELAEKAAFIVQYDDGEANAFFSVSGPHTYEFAMLFEDLGGPGVTLDGFDVCMRQLGADSKIRYEVVVWAADGPGGLPGTELLTVAAVATGVTSTPTFDSTNLDYSLTASDLYLGIRYFPGVDPDYQFCVDYDGIGGAVQPAFYRSNEAGSWNDVQTGFTAPDYNAMMFRAFLSTPGVVAESLIVPGFAVDTTSPTGTTTLFAVRNLTGGALSLDVQYFERDGTLQRTDTVNLGPRETETVNVRDVPGLATDGAGIARGYIEIFGPGEPDLTPLFAGDYFQVDVGDDFATGERMERSIDLCEIESLRFLEFPLPGSGTQITVWLSNPLGTGPADPFSFRVRTYDESGVFLGTTAFKTSRHVVTFPASDLTAVAFGTMEFDFTDSGRGTVFAESSVQGRFSVGVGSQCENP